MKAHDLKNGQIPYPVSPSRQLTSQDDATQTVHFQFIQFRAC